MAAGEKKRAEKRFVDAISKMPRRSDLYLPLLDFYFDEGRTEDAEKYIEKSREEKAFSPRIALFEARLRILASQPGKAIQILDELKYEAPSKTLLLGFALLDDHQLERAVDTLEPVKGSSGATEATALFYVARSLSKDEAVEDSIYQLDRIKSKNGDNAVVHWASAQASVVGADATSSKKKRRARLKTARDDLQRAIELDPNFAPYQFALCEVYMRQLEEDQAESACLKGRALAPEYAPGMVSTAHLRLMQGDFEAAFGLSEDAAKLRPDDPVVGLLRARVAIEQRRLDDAEKHINKWLAKTNDQFELSLLSGRLEFMRENYTKAAGYLKQAFEMRPGDGEASTYYGHTLVRLGQHDEAEEILKDNLSHPTWAGYAWAVLGEVRRKQRRWRDVSENFNKAERLYGDQPIPDRYWSHLYSQWALANKARYRKWRHGKVRKMLRLGRKKGDPRDPELNMTWGRYWLEKRRPDYDKATEALEKVVEEAPFRCDAVEALQRLYKRAEADEKLEELNELHKTNCAPPEEETE
jgi:tetratricopeptide (TPR) repeat protein